MYEIFYINQLNKMDYFTSSQHQYIIQTLTQMDKYLQSLNNLQMSNIFNGKGNYSSNIKCFISKYLLFVL